MTIHLLAMIPPKVSISDYVGTIKGQTAIRVFNKFGKLKDKPYWGNKFWTLGYNIFATQVVIIAVHQKLYFVVLFSPIKTFGLQDFRSGQRAITCLKADFMNKDMYVVRNGMRNE